MGRLPHGFEVELGEDVRLGPGGTTLLGGMPVHLLRVRSELGPTVLGRRFAVTDARTAALAELLLDRGLATPIPLGAGASRRAELTVVVPVKDRAAGLARLLRTVPPDVAVIVVDDGSADPGAIAAVADERGATLHRLPRSRGPAAARNAGLALVRGGLALLCDSDVELEPGAIETVLAHFDDPRVGAVAPRISARRAAEGWIARYEEACSSLDLGPVPALVQPRGRVSYVPSACLAVRRAAVAAGFDDRLHVAEDVDLVWRMVRDGWSVRYEPAAIVRHDHRTSFRPWLGRRAFYGTGAAALAERHGSAVAPAVFAPWSGAVVGLLLLFRPWAAVCATLVLVVTVLRIAVRLPQSVTPLRDAARLALGSVVASALQCGALLTRHWWPLTLVLAVLSPHVRVIAGLAALGDGVWDYAKRRPRLGFARFWAARRLDDLAYGAGVWWGCLRRGSVRALLPALTRW